MPNARSVSHIGSLITPLQPQKSIKQIKSISQMINSLPGMMQSSKGISLNFSLFHYLIEGFFWSLFDCPKYRETGNMNRESGVTCNEGLRLESNSGPCGYVICVLTSLLLGLPHCFLQDLICS